MPSIRDLAKDITMDTAQTLCKDATYIPEERLDWSPMDYGKSANALLAECAKVNYMFVSMITETPAVEPDASMGFIALKGHVVDSAEALCKAIDSLSDEDLEGSLQMPWGAVMPASRAILLPASHMSYHDGQINYIQLLLGDTKFHWLED